MQRKDLDKSYLSENLRVTLFGPNQNKWQGFSQEAINFIVNLISDGKSLFEIYEYARNKRYDISVLMGDINEYPYTFGKIRNSKYCDAYYDEYSHYEFVGNKKKELTLPLYHKIVSIIMDQKHLFEAEEKTSVDNAWPYRLTLYNDKVTEYKTQKEPQPGDVTVRYYNRYYYGNEEPNNVYVIWGKMDEEIYKNKLLKLNSLLNEIKHSEDDTCISKIANLAYDLSRFIPIQRGSAAVAGWIIRAIAAFKGFEIKEMHVKGLPFDIYAHLQSDRGRYAKEFSEEITYTLVNDSLNKEGLACGQKRLA